MALKEIAVRDWDKFTFIAGGTAAFGIPVDFTRPQYMLLTAHHAVDIVFDIIVFVRRNSFPIGFNRPNSRKIVAFTEFGIACPIQNCPKPTFLRLVWMQHVVFDALHAQRQIAFYSFVDEPFHRIRRWFPMGEDSELDML
jgi:hypothetical protein